MTGSVSRRPRSDDVIPCRLGVSIEPPSTLRLATERRNARPGGERFGVNADRTTPPPPSRVALCCLSCGSVSAGANVRRRRASGLFRECSVSRPCGSRSAISSTWQRPTARHPGRSLLSGRQPILPSLPPGCRVVALGEVEEMARTRSPTSPRAGTLNSTISETCRPARAPVLVSSQAGSSGATPGGLTLDTPCVEHEPDLSRVMAAAARSMRAEFERSSVIRHSASKGTARESLIFENYLSTYLPGNVRSAHSGEVISASGEKSGQCDILIFDPSTPPLYVQSTFRLVPVECLYGVIEVKSKLTGPELKSACSSIARLKRLKKSAFVDTLGPKLTRTAYGTTWHHAPTSGFIFAYDFVKLERLAQVFMEITDGQPIEERVDGIWILGKGFLQWLDPATHRLDPGPRTGAELGVIKNCENQDVLLAMTVSLNIHFTAAWMPGPLDIGKYAGPLGMPHQIYSHDRKSGKA